MTYDVDHSASGWATRSLLCKATEGGPNEWQASGTRVLMVDEAGRVPLTELGDLRFARPNGRYDAQRHIFLGTADGMPIFVARDEVPEPAGALREVADGLGDLHREIAFRAVAVTNWHRDESYCSRCGTETAVRLGGYQRQCQGCGRQSFPRTDPAVIVAVIDSADRLLLGGEASWGSRISVFAGFVDAGESAEQALHREIAEEVGLSISDIRYFGSQPWPFPRSLMLAYSARTRQTGFTIDEAEISYADWFTRERLLRDLEDGTITLPPPSSIANRMIYAWLRSEL